jgi:hypothetical protein
VPASLPQRTSSWRCAAFICWFTSFSRTVMAPCCLGREWSHAGHQRQHGEEVWSRPTF